MWVKAYIRHKTGDLVDCDLLFKHGKIQEVNMEFFKGITPFENNSELADNIDILKTYKQDSSNNFCKYFIKKSIAFSRSITASSFVYLEHPFFIYEFATVRYVHSGCAIIKSHFVPLFSTSKTSC